MRILAAGPDGIKSPTSPVLTIYGLQNDKSIKGKSPVYKYNDTKIQ